MAFEVSSNGSNASIAVSSEASDKPGGAQRAAPMQSFNDLADRRIALRLVDRTLIRIKTQHRHDEHLR